MEPPKSTLFTMSSGHEVKLSRLYMKETYSGVIEGTPETASRYILEEISHQIKKIMPPGSPLVLIEENVKALPQLEWIAEFTSYQAVERDDLDYGSRLYVCWFTEEVYKSLRETIEGILSNIDWDKSAEDYDYLTF